MKDTEDGRERWSKSEKQGLRGTERGTTLQEREGGRKRRCKMGRKVTWGTDSWEKKKRKGEREREVELSRERERGGYRETRQRAGENFGERQTQNV